MPQPEFSAPEFVSGSSAEEIHARMMEALPDDIDDMPGGFPYDFTMPAAMEKDEFINFHMIRALMIAFPQYSWDDWLDLHGQQVHRADSAQNGRIGVFEPPRPGFPAVGAIITHFQGASAGRSSEPE